MNDHDVKNLDVIYHGILRSFGLVTLITYVNLRGKIKVGKDCIYITTSIHVIKLGKCVINRNEVLIILKI